MGPLSRRQSRRCKSVEKSTNYNETIITYCTCNFSVCLGDNIVKLSVCLMLEGDLWFLWRYVGVQGLVAALTDKVVPLTMM